MSERRCKATAPEIELLRLERSAIGCVVARPENEKVIELRSGLVIFSLAKALIYVTLDVFCISIATVALWLWSRTRVRCVMVSSPGAN
ncbi:hypothetical protein TNCV_4611931 [Trichonephila clavipes]|nr:hypothetical protein TNCV_4611931 [Trichonephila clavipes]